jgi:hypothetical protein
VSRRGIVDGSPAVMGALLVDDAVELSDMLWQLRHDLTRAMYAGANTR